MSATAAARVTQALQEWAATAETALLEASVTGDPLTVGVPLGAAAGDLLATVAYRVVDTAVEMITTYSERVDGQVDRDEARAVALRATGSMLAQLADGLLQEADRLAPST